MALLRNETQKNFTIVGNYILQSRNVSLKAIGMYSKLVSLPDNWNFTEAGLAAICKDGRDSVKSALKELEELNLLFRFRKRSENGVLGEAIYYISSNPMSEEDKLKIVGRYQPLDIVKTPEPVENKELEPITDFPTLDNPTLDKPTLDKQAQLNTNKLNTNKLNTNNIKKERKKGTTYDKIINELISNEEIKDLMYEFIKMRTLKKKPLTDRALKIQINKLHKLSSDIEIQKQIIEKAIVKTWDEFYPVNNFVNKQGVNNGSYSKSDGSEYEEFDER